MKLYQLFVTTLALGAFAAPNPEANSEVEARDAAPVSEPVQEFDTRSPEEDEILARDEDDSDLLARNYHYRKCGYDAYYRNGQCYCHKYGYYYKNGRCYEKCHSPAYYDHGECKCPRGYYYENNYGCKKYHHGNGYKSKSD